jgi:redox-sensitive bicupin YhaK (pirin superfamily)
VTKEDDTPQESPIVIGTVPLGLHWPTLDPFLFVAHHRDQYPPGNANLGVDRFQLLDRNMGSDFELRDGWRMYHGREVPGFPQHPHRGFETITIAREGYIDHHDSMGASARFGDGDVQWMTAGRGVVHSEMFPLVHADKDNPTELFQIWLNLPTASKMVQPHFKMAWSEDMPSLSFEDGAGRATQVDIVAGALADGVPPKPPPHSWAVEPDHGVQIWRITMEAHGRWTLPAAEVGHARVLYIHAGAQVRVADAWVSASTGVQLDPSAEVVLENGDEVAQMLLLSGSPIREPVVQHGPFVMNSRVELQQAFDDYRRTGFGGWSWSSDAPVHHRGKGRFADHGDGRTEEPKA